MISLHKLNCIGDNILKHTVGITIKNGIYTKIKGILEKNFQYNYPAYALPLFKIHKLENFEISKTRVLDIPVCLVQSAGKITTTKVPAFQMLLNQFQQVSVNIKLMNTVNIVNHAQKN